MSNTNTQHVLNFETVFNRWVHNYKIIKLIKSSKEF